MNNILNLNNTLTCTKEIFIILKQAEQISIKYYSPYIEPIHIFIALCTSNNLFSSLFKKYLPNYRLYNKILLKASLSTYKKSRFLKRKFSPLAVIFLNRAFIDYKYLNSLELASILIFHRDKLILKCLSLLNLTEEHILDTISQFQIKSEDTNELKILNKYTYSISNTNLNIPLIYREKELTAIIEILSRNLNNNPILVGEIGSGRFSILKTLIKQIKEQEVPIFLQHKEIKILNLSMLLKNSQYKGDLEEQFEMIINACKKKTNLILACLDIHYLFNLFNTQATNDQDNVSSLNMFINAFKERNIQIIGITTPKEYFKQVNSNIIIKHFFDKVIIQEPTITETFNIISATSKNLEKFYKLKITSEIIKETISLSDKYLKNKTFPLKGIELLDLAAWKTKFKNITNESSNSYVNSEELYEALAQISELPKEMISPTSNVKQNIKKLEAKLKEKIHGQKTAVETISKTIKSALLGLKQNNKPIGSWFLCGPSGTGKTELAKTITKILFGSETKMLRFDMSEFMEKHSLSRLIGSPPGYVGYGEGGQLTDSVSKNPYCVLLFDEIEKAHSDITNIMLQILDDGRLTDSTGKQIDFSNTIILFTSNLGCPKTLEDLKDFDNNDYDRSLEIQIRESVKSYFKPEFINRINEIIIFKPLIIETLVLIANKFLNQFQVKLKENKINISIAVHSNVILFLAKLSYNPLYGARPLKRLLEKLIEIPISDLLIKFKFTRPHLISFFFDKSSDTLTYSIKQIR